MLHHAKLGRTVATALLATVFAVPAFATADSTSSTPASVTDGLTVQGNKGGSWSNKPNTGGSWSNKPRPSGGGSWSNKPNTGGSRWGGNHQGRWIGGWNAPGGWNSYVRPNVGFMIGSYWTQPTFYIPNYTVYGWPAPYQGAAWSRYYNDAVMIDGGGRVYDYRYDVDWDRYDSGPVPVYAGGGYGAPDGYYTTSYDQGYSQAIDPNCRRADSNADGTVGGAVVGGVGGALAGRAIGGRGNRTEGAIIGGVVGAVAGGAIGNSLDRNEGQIVCPGGYYADGYGQQGYVTYEDNVTYGSYGQPYEVVQAPPPPPRVERRETHVYRPAPQPQPRVVYAQPSYGYAYGAPSVTTVVVQGAPTVTTTTYVEEEVTYATAYRPAKRTWKAKPKAKPKPRVVTCTCR